MNIKELEHERKCKDIALGHKWSRTSTEDLSPKQKKKRLDRMEIEERAEQKRLESEFEL